MPLDDPADRASPLLEGDACGLTFPLQGSPSEECAGSLARKRYLLRASAFPTIILLREWGTSLHRQVHVQRRLTVSVTARDPITKQNVVIHVPNSRAATTKASLLRQSGYRDIVIERKVAAARKPHDGDE